MDIKIINILINLEYFDKTNRMLCGFKYDIHSLNDKIDKIYDKLDGLFDKPSNERNDECSFQLEVDQSSIRNRK